MTSLIESVLSLEKQADDVLAQAATEAKAIEQKAVADIAAFQKDLAARIDQAIAAARAEAEKKSASDLAAAEKAFQKQMDAIRQIRPEAVKDLAARVASRFAEI